MRCYIILFALLFYISINLSPKLNKNIIILFTLLLYDDIYAILLLLLCI